MGTAPSIRFAPLQQEDLPLLEALQPSDWGSILPPHKFYVSSAFCFPLKFMIDGTLVGIGTSISHKDSAWLGHIIVHPEHRKKGIGEFITKTLMNESIARNRGLLFLTATDVGEPLYRKLGFEIEAEYLFYKDLQAFADSLPGHDTISYEQTLAADNALLINRSPLNLTALV